LSQTVQEKQKSETWKFANLFRPVVPGGEKEQTTTSRPSDSRTIELKFLNLLESLQQKEVNIFGVPFSFPNPEINFVFDELDKLLDKSSSIERENVPRFRDSVNVNISKRHINIQKLMSDMKNVISSADAKFIFIGGRELQDSWFADQTDRNPLLTSIFDGVIYLPSLLVNSNSKNNKKITDSIYGYFYSQFSRANIMMKAMDSANRRSSVTSVSYNRKRMEYTQEAIHLTKIKNNLFHQQEVKFVYQISQNSELNVYQDSYSQLVSRVVKNNRQLSLKYCINLYLIREDFSLELLPTDLDIGYIDFPSLSTIFFLQQSNEQIDVNKVAEVLNMWSSYENICFTFENITLCSLSLNNGAFSTGSDALTSSRAIDEIDPLVIYRISSSNDKNMVDRVDDHYKKHFIGNFINFLSYRSQGNPKKLGELFSTLIYPAGRVFSKKHENTPLIENKMEQQSRQNCQSVLYLSDINMVRVQLLSQLFERLEHYFHESLAGRDDKIIGSIFYLSDFLFKFHKRAFAWDSLEKIDELSDINRAPDIRSILQQIVNASSPLFFHQVLNGMYVFRFRSEMSKEISYISRFSPTEMAAFNFTLDESTPLKELYLNKLKDGKSGEPALISSLGELYEYDEEYDSARKEYNRALFAIDKQLIDQTGGNCTSDEAVNEQSQSIIFNILQGKDLNTCRLFGSWAVFRLRLMLQIGMTYEQSKNLERAQMQYSDADNFAKRIVQSLVGQTKESLFSGLGFTPSEQQPDELNNNALHVLKHFNLLYQPLFAKAWVAEKLEGSVDTSIDIVEKEIEYLRHLLPFSYVQLDISSSKTSNSYLYLVMSEVHNKTGDLCFFKGLSVNYSSDNEVPSTKDIYMGYLFQAHYHYAMSLHEIRDYIAYRINNAKFKFGVPYETQYFGVQAFPVFVCTTLASNLCDMGEATVARVNSVNLLFCAASSNQEPVQGDYEAAYLKKSKFKKFITGIDKECTEAEEAELKALWLQWFGKSEIANMKRKSSDSGDNKKQLLQFNLSENNDFERFAAYLAFSEMSYEYLLQGGYTEDAINEYLKSIRTIIRVLAWHKIEYLYDNSDMVQSFIRQIFIRLTKVLKKATSLNSYNHRIARADSDNIISMSIQEVTLVRVIASAFMVSAQLQSNDEQFYQDVFNPFVSSINGLCFK
jgi:hypothetical protein